MTPQTHDRLEKPTPGAQGSHPDAVQYATAKPVWNKKNAEALGLMQATVSPVIWQGKWALGWMENCFRKAGGATTYLQL